ncbi:uncharacterized protein MKZ38_007653 [Zalerion maritima]|uniref:DM2 domain-containing protein n=1 Tax=Zalerion maritima TaxID=339359 RepID=A0AAD5RZS3_9PEZI|nr:uncharacterized protein MKZ38_007653 [Zalerion maritima]
MPSMQQQYRGYAGQTPTRGSHGNARKGGIGPMISQGHHHPPPMTQAQIQAQAHAQQMATEHAKRRSRKPTDKNMPDGVEDIMIGDGVQKYKDLRDFERRLDATMTRKRLDIIDSVARNAKRTKTLRIWITNTVEDQPWQASMDNSLDYQANGTPSYRVKIEGRLLDDEHDQENHDSSAGPAADDADKMDEDPKPSSAGSKKPAALPAPAPKTTPPKPRFSTFFREMMVEFPPNMPKSAETTVHWKKPDPPRAANASSSASSAHHGPPAAADFDELTFKRVGDQNVNVVIKLTRHEDPEKFLLSDELAEIVDMKEATRTEVTMGLWEYIKLMGLQEDDEKRNFSLQTLCQQDMLTNILSINQKIANRETGYLPNLNEYVQPHLSPLPPISLPYTIRVDQAFHSLSSPSSPSPSPSSPQPTIYDVLVPIPDPLGEKMRPFILNPSYASMLKEVATLDDQLSLIVQAIQHSKAKHSFLTQMAQDPVGFTKGWISSQKRDLEYIMGEASRGGGEDAVSDEWRRVGAAAAAAAAAASGDGKGRGGGGGKDAKGPWETGNARESVTMMLAKGGPPPSQQAAAQAVAAAAAAASQQGR